MTFNSPVLYSNVIEYIDGNCDFTNRKEQAHNFSTLKDVTDMLFSLNGFGRHGSELEVLEVIGLSETLVDEDTIKIHKDEKVIDGYKEQIKELESEIKKIESSNPYKRATVEDVKIGTRLFVVSAMKNRKYLGTREVIVKSDIIETNFGIKMVEVETIDGTSGYFDKELFLGDAGIIPNNYNKSKTFLTKKEADAYAREFNSSK